MIRQLRWLLLIAAILIICAAVWESLHQRRERQVHAVEFHEALRKTAEFLKPDTTSDLRFGKKASGVAPAPATPTPTTP